MTDTRYTFSKALLRNGGTIYITYITLRNVIPIVHMQRTFQRNLRRFLWSNVFTFVDYRARLDTKVIRDSNPLLFASPLVVQVVKCT